MEQQITHVTTSTYSNTIELTLHTSCYCILDLLCVSRYGTKKLLCEQSEYPTYLNNGQVSLWPEYRKCSLFRFPVCLSGIMSVIQILCNLKFVSGRETSQFINQTQEKSNSESFTQRIVPSVCISTHWNIEWKRCFLWKSDHY